MSSLAAFAAFGGLVLLLDRASTEPQQQALGAVGWAFLAVALWREPRVVRVQVLTLVAVATVLECVGSLVWGAYTYRLGNLPLYVPAGHGLFYLAALKLSALPAVARRARGIVLATGALATGYMLWGLARPPVPDLLGFVTWAVFVRFLIRGRSPVLYAVSFALTTALELYGTGLGIWRWSPLLPGLWLPAGNPPTGIGAGYAAMDALTRRIVATARRGRGAASAPDASRAGSTALSL